MKILLCSSFSLARTRRLCHRWQDWRLEASFSSSSASDSAASKCFLRWVFPFVNSAKWKSIMLHYDRQREWLTRLHLTVTKVEKAFGGSFWGVCQVLLSIVIHFVANMSPWFHLAFFNLILLLFFSKINK